MSVQMSLELAVSTLGVGHKITLMLSEERDKEIVLEQRKIFNEWKETVTERNKKVQPLTDQGIGCEPIKNKLCISL